MRRYDVRWARFFVVFGLIIVAGGCFRGGATASPPKPPADTSLTAAEYRRLGVPNIDQPWSGADMSVAAQAIASIARRNPSELPRYQSKHSGEVFSRLTADENLEQFRDASRPIEQRLPEGLAYFQGMQGVVNAYLPAFQQQKTGGVEMIELLGAIMKAAVMMDDLASEFMPKLDPRDPSYPVRIEGMRTMKRGFGQMVDGSLITLTESNAYTVAERKQFIAHLKKALPKIVAGLSPEQREEIINKLKSHQQDPKLQDLQPDLDELAAACTKTQTADER
ncbi:MAG: hypothetical protein RIC55_05915 [Pirellulaceae bacterium]